MSSPEKAPVIGIDIGTAYLSVGVWDPSLGRVRLIADEYGKTRIPSCVAFTDSHRLIGTAAYDVNQMRSNLENTIFGTKRLIGRKLSEPIGEDMKQWPFKVEKKHDLPVVSVDYKNQKKKFSCEEITAMTISKLQQLAEDDLGCPVKEAVIAVPSFFTNLQRQSMIDAGTIAGLDVLQIVNEGSASAIHFAKEKRVSRKKTIMILDIGAGTVDVSICKLEKKGLCEVVEVVATAGDTSLGGMDFDKMILDYCVRDIKKKLRRDITENKEALMMLRRCCERAKVELSSKENASIQLDCDGIEYRTELYRTIFDELCTELIKKCIELVNKCLRDGHLVSTDVDDVLLVGGCTRIPAVQQRLKSCLDGEAALDVKPHEFVVGGAAYLGASLSGLVDDLLFRDVANLSFTWEYKVSGLSPLTLKSKMKNKKKELISKNTPIPTKSCQIKMSIEKSFLQPNDRKIVVKVFEGDNNVVGEVEGGKLEDSSKLLGKFELCTKGCDIVTVTAKADANGILSLSAQGNDDQDLSITGDTGRLNAMEITEMLEEAAEHRLEDEEIWKKAKSIYLSRNIIQLETFEEVPETLEEVTATLDDVHDASKKVSKRCCACVVILIIIPALFILLKSIM